MKVGRILRRKRDGDAGYTVIELVIATSVLAVVALGAMGALRYAAASSVQTDRREQALAVANRHLEQIRNLNYDDIGTVSGYPTGDIPNSQDDGVYTVQTTIGWSHDLDTGLSTSKNIKVTVLWSEPTPGTVTIESNIAGKSSIVNAGDVKINVVDAETGDPIVGALVKIKPLSGAQSSSMTNSNGYAYWGKVPAGAITITCTKSGYFINLDTIAGASVAPNELNEWTVTAEEPSTGIIYVKDQFGDPVPGASVKLTKSPFTNTVVTDSEGKARFDDLGKGTYTVVSTGPSGYSTGSGSLAVTVAGGTYYCNLTVTKYARLFVTVVDENDNVVPGAAVSVTGPGSVTPASATSGADGKTAHVLGAGGTYTASVTKSGYLSGSGSQAVVAGADGSLTVMIEQLKTTTFIVKVVDQNGAAVSGANVTASGAGSVSPASATSDGSGYVTFTVGLPGAYTATASKTGYTPNSVASGTIPNGGTVTKQVAITKLTDGWMDVKYTSNPSPNPKTVYIYQQVGATWVKLGTTLSFTARNQTRNSGPHPEGSYAVSTKASYDPTSAKPVTITAGATASVSLSSSN